MSHTEKKGKNVKGRIGSPEHVSIHLRYCKMGKFYDNFRVATVREKYLENEIFSRSGKSQGILWLAREIWRGLGKSGKSLTGNLEINSYGRQSSENLFMRIMMYFLISPSPSSLGATPLGEQILSFKSNPQNRSDIVSTIKVKNKIFFFNFQRVWKTVKCQENIGKVREF